MPGVEKFVFHEKREAGASLREIKAIQKARADLRQDINDAIITTLNSRKGFKIKRGDTLAQLNALTVSGNRLEFNDDANRIMEGDIIRIKEGLLYRNDTIVGSVSQGFKIPTRSAIASVKQEVETSKKSQKSKRPRTRQERNRDIETNEIHDGTKLASYIAERGYPIWRSGAFCGQNVGNMLSEFGSPQLPTWGRHGYRWSGFLDGNPGFRRERISSPMEAKAGGICVYDKGFGYTDERQTYGHVEVALGNGDFYYGHKRNRPGGSIDASKHPSGFTGYVYYPVTSKFDDMLVV